MSKTLNSLEELNEMNRHFLSCFYKDVGTLPPLSKFVKILLSHAYLLHSHQSSLNIIHSLFSLLEQFMLLVLQATLDGRLSVDLASPSIKIYLKRLLQTKTIPDDLKTPLVQFLNKIKLLGTPNTFLLREDVELSQFLPIQDPSASQSLDLSLLQENVKEEPGIRMGQLLHLGMMLAEAASFFYS